MLHNQLIYLGDIFINYNSLGDSIDISTWIIFSAGVVKTWDFLKWTSNMLSYIKTSEASKASDA